MVASRRGLRQTLVAMAYGDYRRFAISLGLTSLGAQLLQTAILWQVYELTGSALLLGLTGLARAAPHMLLSLVGGVVADRWDRVRLIQAGQAVNAVIVLALAALTFTHRVEVWHLYVITLLNAGFTALTQPARTALIPRLIPEGNLVSAIGLNATIGQVAQILGPALAGVTIAWFGLGSSYLLTGLCYVGSMISIMGIRTPATPEATGENPWQAFLEGLDFVRRKPVIMSLLLLDVSATLFGSYRALLPIFADAIHVGAGGYGLLSAAPGVGSLFGAAFVLSQGDMKRKGLYTVFGVLAYAASLIIFALSPWFLMMFIASALLGATNAVQMIPRNTVILAISPDHLRGRVEAFRSMLAGGAPPLGYMLSGAAAAALGAPLAVMLGAVACGVVAAGIGLTRRELRDPDLGSEAAIERVGSDDATTASGAYSGR